MASAACVKFCRSAVRTREIVFGSILAGLLTVAFTVGNSFTDRELGLQTFPGWIPLAAIPAFVYVAQRMQHQNEPLQTGAALKQHGWNVVKWAAPLFALGAVAVCAVRASRPAPFLLIVFGMSLVSTAVVGYVAADACSRIIAKQHAG